MADEMKNSDNERLELGSRAWPVFIASLIIGVIGLAVAVGLGWSQQDSFRRFYFAYTTSWAFFVSIVAGAVLFVLCQHACRAGWSVNVRRLAELIGATTPVVAVLAAPIVVSILMNNGSLYSWAQPLPPVIEKPVLALPADAASMTHQKAQLAEERHLEATAEAAAPTVEHHADDATMEKLAELGPSKRVWLSSPFFIARMVVYLALWSLVGLWYWRMSVQQDETGDIGLTHKMQRHAGWLLVFVISTQTLAAWDWFMSLDPTWYSTIFGIYYFAGCVIAIFSVMVVITAILQRGGWLQSVTKEHYHDMGKFMFAFVFFWGYIAYSQYMLTWYANIPEELAWWNLRGASTVTGNSNGWSVVLLVILFCMFVLPFAGLLSRHVKRRRASLIFWAVALLAAHWVEMWWIIMPEYNGRVVFGIMEVATFLGIGGIVTAAGVRLAARHALRPLRDPRLSESMAFENI